MQTKSLVRALEKAGLKVVNAEFNGQPSQCWWCAGEIYTAGWRDDDGTAIGVWVQGSNEEIDSQTDYFPRWYPKRVKDVVASLMTPRGNI